ncbi:MAG: recombinase family protein [Mesorhizobium sp.]
MMNPQTKRRAVAYARYSTELQSDRSIEDQITLCRDFAARSGFDVMQTYYDRAKSGASLVERDGLLRLLADAKTGGFEAVIVEAIDRVSRDQEDLAAIYKRLKFLGIEIIAVHDGKADTIQIGIRGLIGAMYIEDLKHKVRRGMAGRARDGMSAGGKAYGYSPVPGKPGELEINEAEAEIVRRIYREYAAGASPREIVTRLNKDGIAPPRGACWHTSALKGSHTRSYGLLRNAIYSGKLVWNRVRMVRDPETGKRVSRQNSESEWQHADVPHLRIIDQEMVDAVAARLASQHDRYQAHEYTPRRPRMLSGLLRCGSCGGGMTLDGQSQGRPRIRCVRARDAGVCDHRRKYPLDVIERAVVDGLRDQMGNPAALALYVETYLTERRRLAREAASNRGRIERELARKKGEIERMIDLVIKGVLSSDRLIERKGPLDADIARLEAELVIAPPIDAVELHPAALAAYTADLNVLSGRLAEAQGDPSSKLIEPLRRLVDAIVIRPSDGYQPIEIEIKGKLGILLGENVALPPAKKLARKVVAGEGFEPPT